MVPDRSINRILKKSPRPQAKKLKLLYFTFDKIALLFCTCCLTGTLSEKDEILKGQLISKGLFFFSILAKNERKISAPAG